MKELKTLFLKDLHYDQKVIKNAFWLYLSEFLAKGLRVVIFLLIVRILGPYNFGIFEYFLSFVGLFFLFSDFGISPLFIRDYQQKENKKELINSIFLLKLSFAFIFGFLALVGYFLSKKIGSFLLYSIFVLFYIVQNIESFFESYFIAIQKTEKKFIFNTFSTLFLFGLIIISIFVYRNVFGVALSYFLSVSAELILAYFLFRKEDHFSLKFNFQLIKYYLYNGLPLVLWGVLWYIFFSVDKVIISHLRPIEETGYYSLASRIINTFFLIPSIFNTALLPFLSKKVKENNEGIENLFKISVISSILAGFLFSLLIFIFAPFLILIFGQKYTNSILILQFFSWVLIFIFPIIFLDNFLISCNKQWLGFSFKVIPAVLNLVLNFILIHSYGVLGAVYSSLISQFLNFILTFALSSHILRISKSKKENL